MYRSRYAWFCKRESTEHVFIFTLHDNVAWMCLIFSSSFSKKTRAQQNGICNYISVCVWYSIGIHFDLIDSGSFMHTQVERVWMKIYRSFFASPFFILLIAILILFLYFFLSITWNFSHMPILCLFTQRLHILTYICIYYSILNELLARIINSFSRSFTFCFNCFYDIIEWREIDVHGTSNNRLSGFPNAINTSITFWHKCALSTIHWILRLSNWFGIKIEPVWVGCFLIFNFINGIAPRLSKKPACADKKCHLDLLPEEKQRINLFDEWTHTHHTSQMGENWFARKLSTEEGERAHQKDENHKWTIKIVAEHL